jgi:serine/threonine protein kinase
MVFAHYLINLDHNLTVPPTPELLDKYLVSKKMTELTSSYYTEITQLSSSRISQPGQTPPMSYSSYPKSKSNFYHETRLTWYLKFENNELELEYWDQNFRRNKNKPLHFMLFFSIILCPAHILIDNYFVDKDTEYMFYNMRTPVVEALFYTTQIILLFMCLLWRQSLRKRQMNLQDISRFHLFFHCVVIFLGSVYIYIQNSTYFEREKDVTNAICGEAEIEDYLVFSVYLIWAPLAGFRFIGMLAKAVVDTILFLYVQIRENDYVPKNLNNGTCFVPPGGSDAEKHLALTSIILFVLYFFACLSAFMMELSFKRRFIQTKILRRNNIHQNMRLDPFKVEHLIKWVSKKGKYEDQLLEDFQFVEKDDVPTRPRENWDLDFRDLVLGPRVASGGAGFVRKGELGNSPVAIKQLFNTITDPLDLAEFANEARTLFTLGSFPSIVRMFGISHNRGAVFLIMEWCESTLERVISTGPEIWPTPQKIGAKDLEYRFVVHVAVQICSAVNFLHRHKIVHLDLKPANILVQHEFKGLCTGNETLQIKLCDFGLSKCGDDLSGKVAGGTPLFMAPERLRVLFDRSDRESKIKSSIQRTKTQMDFELLQKADVYAFAFVLYAMTHNNVIFDKEIKEMRQTDLVSAICNNLRPKFDPACPSELSNIICLCWDDSPRVRPSFAQLCKMLTALLPPTPQQPWNSS